MSKPSPKKQQKHKTRKTCKQKKLFEQKQRLVRKQKYKEQYPSFVLRNDGASDEFVTFVKTALDNVDYDNRNQFSNQQRILLRDIKKHGARFVVDQLIGLIVVRLC